MMLDACCLKSWQCFLHADQGAIVALPLCLLLAEQQLATWMNTVGLCGTTTRTASGCTSGMGVR